MPAIAVAAPAKINLTLRVVGRRPDGYHLIESLVVFAEIHDRIEVRPAEDLSLAIEGPFAPALMDSDGRDNLVMRAAQALQQVLGERRGAAIRLAKHLPVASGIGGGSADAAATLRALCRLWDVAMAEPELASIGLRLGADVPVCLNGRPALMTGIGETIEPLPPLPDFGMLLVNPGVPLSTQTVFRGRKGPFSAPGLCAAAFEGLSDTGALARFLQQFDNDLARPAAELAPAIQDVLSAIEATPDCLVARLSGSGATCFGLYMDEAAARTAAARVAAAHPAWWTAPTRLRR